MTNGRSKKNTAAVKIMIAGLAVLLVLLIVALIVNLVRLGAANSRRESLARQNAKLEQIIEQNDDMITYCQSSEFIEEYAREMLDMIYRGETVVGSKDRSE